MQKIVILDLQFWANSGLLAYIFSLFCKLLLSKHYFWSYSDLYIYDHKSHKLDGNPEDLYNYSIWFYALAR